MVFVVLVFVMFVMVVLPLVFLPLVLLTVIHRIQQLQGALVPAHPRLRH